MLPEVFHIQKTSTQQRMSIPVFTVYIKNKKKGKGKKNDIALSMRSSYVNRHLQMKNIGEGFTLSGCIASKEDHGYIISFGVDGGTAAPRVRSPSGRAGAPTEDLLRSAQSRSSTCSHGHTSHGTVKRPWGGELRPLHLRDLFILLLEPSRRRRLRVQNPFRGRRMVPATTGRSIKPGCGRTPPPITDATERTPPPPMKDSMCSW